MPSFQNAHPLQLSLPPPIPSATPPITRSSRDPLLHCYQVERAMLRHIFLIAASAMFSVDGAEDINNACFTFSEQLCPTEKCTWVGGESDGYCTEIYRSTTGAPTATSTTTTTTDALEPTTTSNATPLFSKGKVSPNCQPHLSPSSLLVFFGHSPFNPHS